MLRILIPVTKTYENEEMNCLTQLATCCGIFARPKKLFGYRFMELSFHSKDDLDDLKKRYEQTRIAAINQYFPAQVALAEFVINQKDEVVYCVKLHCLQQQALTQKFNGAYRPILNFCWIERKVNKDDITQEQLNQINADYKNYLAQQEKVPFALKRA